MNNLLMTKRIGTTTYQVKIYFSNTATETMEDKVFRIIQNHPLAGGKDCDIINVSQMSRSA